MHKAWKIFNWCVSIYCIMAALAFGFSLASLLFLIVGITSLPIHAIRKHWNKIFKGKKTIRVLVLTILFFWACFVAPKQQESLIEEAQETERMLVVTAPLEEEAQLEAELSIVEEVGEFSLEEIPAYSGIAYVVVNENVPYFSASDIDKAKTSYEFYSDFDSFGRCGVCIASVGQDIMPTEERGEIGNVRPTGWHTVKYNEIIDGNYLYNRCHLIAYQLAGENENTQNLITGTRYLNVEGMLPFENMVTDYVMESGNHVLYRVTPIFEGENLLATGVLMEAKSVEDNGEGIQFNVFCYNVQPGIIIDYTNGDSATDETKVVEEEREVPVELSKKESVPVEPTLMEPASTLAAEPFSDTQGDYAVNGKNGKIHIVGKCPATGTGDNSMKRPVYFNTYDEAESYSIDIKPGLEKRKCGNCW